MRCGNTLDLKTVNSFIKRHIVRYLRGLYTEDAAGQFAHTGCKAVCGNAGTQGRMLQPLDTVLLTQIAE